MPKEALITAETNIGKPSRNTKPKEIPYDELKAAALALPIKIRASLTNQLLESCTSELDAMNQTAQEAKIILNGK